MEDGKKKMKWGSMGSEPEIAELCVNLCKLMDYSSFVKPLNSPWLPYYFPPFMEAPVAKNCHVADKDRQRNNAKNIKKGIYSAKDITIICSIICLKRI